MIQLDDLWRTYVMGDQELHALRSVNETIESGEQIVVGVNKWTESEPSPLSGEAGGIASHSWLLGGP